MKKILIYVEGGNIQMVASNTTEIEIVVVDRDNQDAGDNPVVEYVPDQITDDFRSLFAFNDNSDQEIRDELKRIKF